MIPKVANYSGFQSYGILPTSALKPGQPDLYGVPIYKESSKFQEISYLKEKTVWKSNYGFGNEKRNPQEYLNQKREVCFDKRGRSTLMTAQEQRGPTSTVHWKSVHQSDFENSGRQQSKSKPPDWSLPRRPVTTVAYPQRLTEAHHSLGRYGEIPRHRLNHDSTYIPKQYHDLSAGTSKASNGIPGYQGHIPKQLLAGRALQHGQLENPRTTFIKQNIVENFHTRIPGYSGHRPTSCINDRGNIRPYCLTTKDETFH